ncbi:MAG: phosphatase PAP2 family protein [Planctomycetota bacterium]
MPDSDKDVPQASSVPPLPSVAVPRQVSWISKIFRWIGQHDRAVLASLFLITAAIWTFLKLADAVSERQTLHFDEWLLRILRRPDNLAVPIGPPWLLEVGRDLSALGGITVLTLLILTVSGFLGLRRMYGAMWLVLGSATGGAVAVTILKNVFDRPRPGLVPHLSGVFTSSFPSGHSMLSATVFLTLGTLLGQFVHERLLKAYFLTIALILTLLVGASRVFLGVHYPSDVLAGWSAGLAWALICGLVAKYLQRRGAVERDAETR